MELMTNDLEIELKREVGARLHSLVTPVLALLKSTIHSLFSFCSSVTFFFGFSSVI